MVYIDEEDEKRQKRFDRILLAVFFIVMIAFGYVTSGEKGAATLQSMREQNNPESYLLQEVRELKAELRAAQAK